MPVLDDCRWPVCNNAVLQRNVRSPAAAIHWNTNTEETKPWATTTVTQYLHYCFKFSKVWSDSWPKLQCEKNIKHNIKKYKRKTKFLGFYVAKNATAKLKYTHQSVFIYTFLLLLCQCPDSVTWEEIEYKQSQDDCVCALSFWHLA